MKHILVFTVLAALALGKSQAAPSACDSCRSMVQSFIDASKDQLKMSKLKVSLSMLCTGTSHQSDCFKTVDKLDFIAYKLAPYLTDTSAVCSKLQMCGESQLSPLARLAMLYLKKSESVVSNDNMMRQQVCDECQESSSQLGKLFEDGFTSYAVKSTVQRLACRSAGKAEKACNVFIASVVPDLMAEMKGIFSEKEQMCSSMGLCSASGGQPAARDAPKQPLSELWKTMGVVKTSNGEQLMSCFECTLSVDALIEEFINKRQSTADEIQEIACAKVVANWTAGCNDFVHMYMSTILYLTYNQFDGRELCTLIHTCEKKESALIGVGKLEKARIGCENCEVVEKFVAENQEALHSHAVEAVYSRICENLPAALLPMCEASATRLSRRFFARAGRLAASGAVCSQLC